MSTVSERTLKRLFALSRNVCAFPKCQTPIVQPSGTITGEVCHIRGRSPDGPRYDASQSDEDRNGFNNLVLLCRVCHKIVDAEPDKYSHELLTEIKQIHERSGSCEITNEDALRAKLLHHDYILHLSVGDVFVMKASPGAVQGKNIKISTSSRKVAVAAHPDSIGADLPKSNYIKYLVKRYQDCQKWDKTKEGRGKYIAIHNAIKTEFGAKWADVSRAQFERLCLYLQRRITNTKLGRIKSGSHDLFSTFEEFLRKRPHD